MGQRNISKDGQSAASVADVFLFPLRPPPEVRWGHFVPNVVPLFLCGRQESELPSVMQAAKVRKTAGQACSVHMCWDRAAAAQQLLWR